MRDRRREQRNRRVPAESLRQGEVGRATARKSRRRRGGAARNSFIAAALAPAAAASGCSASATMSRKASARPRSWRRPKGPRRSAAIRSVGASSRDDREANRRHRRCMRPAGLVCVAPTGARCSASRSAGSVLAQPRQSRAAGRGAQGQALAQRAGERRIVAQESDPTKRGRRRRRTPPRSPRRRRRLARSAAAPKTEMPVPTVGWSARNRRVRAGAIAAAARRRAPAERIGGGTFVIEDVGGIELDHGFSITQGGALSPFRRQIRRACLAIIYVR